MFSGFVTLSALAEDATKDNIFKCGIAVAPVTNWIYYDTIYTERYLGLPNPDDNLRGYVASDLAKKAPRLRGEEAAHGARDGRRQRALPTINGKNLIYIIMQFS